MMKQGRVGVRAHYAFSSQTQYDVRMHEAGWGGRWAGLRGGGTSAEDESHSKHSQMIKGY